MNKKQTYTSPEVEVFVVQIEDCILTVPSPAVLNAMGLFDISEGHGLIDDTDGWGNDF